MSAQNAPSEAVLSTIFNSKDLPTLPIIASKLLVLTAQEDTPLTEIATLISQDMGLSTKILRVANSSFYSFPQQIASINQAVSILGLNAVRSLVLSFSFLSLGEKNKKSKFNFEQFWERSLVEAAGTKLILEQIPYADTEEAFTCGLLQNIGQLIFATTLSQEYEQILNSLEAGKQDNNNGQQIDQRQLEQELIGITHTEVGFEVAKMWGLPESLLLPIKFHHQPTSYEGTNEKVTLYIRAAYLAGLLANIFYSETPEVFHKQFRTEAKNLLQLKIRGVNTVLKMIDQTIGQSANFFGIKINEFKSVAEILQEANLRLSLINLSYEEMNRELIKSKMALEKITEELEQKNRLLENLANLDGLTEINNHRYFQIFLDSEINRCIRNERSLGLLLADIDHFKKLNDTYGHQTGDFILKEFSRITKEVIREYDLIARYGGEEFVFVLPETGEEDALAVAEKLRKTVEDYPFDDGNLTYHVTISVGVACAVPSEDEEFNKNDFINNADEALYEAKNNGRNRVVLHHPKKKKKWYNF
ncbi:GGDEF domain-containing protein [Desulfobulbus rhabdoformis]|uniref:sensor domain-containing diguanylate cyclase n=1 Tax=Desulfobulbus rhabdoformis TaxID=34032 RepID=UPI0019622DFD|nr:GGDEF domain-containing protein [Desulfobulbus rhabdoformis]MBM9612725.1 GGDEF domain-containing protein [Desulfobulbus rhabdoformis]